jgi:Heavy-metal resistance protein CzcE
MKQKLLVPAALAAALGITSWSASAAVLYAEAAPATSATRTVVINPNTRWVNATEMETVKFVANGHEFAVQFDGVRSEFPLNAVAPAGALDHQVKVFVQPSPDYSAGG